MWLFTFSQQRWGIFILGFYFTCEMGKTLVCVKMLFPFHLFRERKKYIINDCLDLLFLQLSTLSPFFLSFLPSIRPSMHPSIHPSICPSIHVPTHLLIHSFINKPLFNSNWGHWETGQLEVLFSLGEYSNMPKVRRTPNEMTSEGELPNWSYSLQRVTRLAQIGMTIH